MKHYVTLQRTWEFIPVIGFWFRKYEIECVGSENITLEFWIPFFHFVWFIGIDPMEKYEKIING